jgi:hypothetical protein
MKRLLVFVPVAFVILSAALQSQSPIQSRAAEQGAVVVGMSAPGGSKICSVYVTNTWRDSVNVGPAFTKQACIDYMTVEGGTQYQLACLYSNGIGFGQPGGGLPAQNCGWK